MGLISRIQYGKPVPVGIHAGFMQVKEQQAAYITKPSGALTALHDRRPSGFIRIEFLPVKIERTVAEVHGYALATVDVALDEIQSTFGLTVEALGELCGVTRQAVYGWKQGAEPRKETLDRLFQLRWAAINWQASGFEIPSHVEMHTPVIRNQSLWALLNDNPLDQEAIQFAGRGLRLSKVIERGQPLKDPFG